MAGNLKEVRERIRSVKNTQQITRAMKMVSAAKLRRAQDAITQMRPYADKLDAMLRNILSNLEGGDFETAFGEQRDLHKACVVVVTSNRGLCGAFNSNVIKAALAAVEGKYADVHAAGNLSLLFVGKRGYDYFRRRYTDITLIDEYVDLFSDLSFDHVSQLAQVLMTAFEEGQYDVIDVAYGRFKNAAVQFPELETWLPVRQLHAEESNGRRAWYTFEPDMESLLSYLIPRILQTQFHKFMLDTHASEHGARMTAMDKATENADELLGDLRLSYNKARQEAITKELSEIVGGAAALGG